MIYTFHNVEISIDADNAHDAYKVLHRLFRDASVVGHCTDTYSEEGREEEEYPTAAIFTQERNKDNG